LRRGIGGRLAQRAGLEQTEAERDALAVFAALPEKEFRDTVAQLPGEYRPLLKSR
jgi:hypothetical protein